MRRAHVSNVTRAVVVGVCLLLLATTSGLAQESGRMTIQAVATGSGTQLGRVFNVNIRIEEASTPEDQRVLLEAFGSHGMKGLINALSKMSSKGRISMPATLGFDINYVRIIQAEDGGRIIRMVTDRPLSIGEVWTDSRSTDYSLSAFEIKIPAGKDKGTGTLFPACQFSVEKGQLTIEALQNPWKLTNVVER